MDAGSNSTNSVERSRHSTQKPVKRFQNALYHSFKLLGKYKPLS